MKNIFSNCKITKAALAQRGAITWTIDKADLPSKESMRNCCNSFSQELGKQVKWEETEGTVLALGMVKVTFRIEAWEKPALPVMPFQAWRSQQQKP